MQTYSLTIQIDTAGRRKMQQFNEQIAIVKSFVEPDLNPVVCMTFAPFGQDNRVQFIPMYYLYASTQIISASTTVNMSIRQQAIAGNTYTFRQGEFNGGEPGIPNKYGFDNQHKGQPILATGLAQKVIMPNESQQITPLNIAASPYNEIIYFEPKKQALVFVATNMESGLILPTNILKPVQRAIIIGRYTVVDFSTDPSPTIHYDNQNNTFVPGSLPDESITGMGTDLL